MRKTVFVAVSWHGLGHIAQTAPVINELYRRQPELDIVLACTAPEEVLQRHFSCPFQYVHHSVDISMLMGNALDVLTEETAAAYQALHSRWEDELAAETARLQHFSPYLVFANIPYIVIAAAKCLGIPAIAMCSLNWAEILRGCTSGFPGMASICTRIEASYNAADIFLCPEPSMAMPGIGCLQSIGPIARIGQSRRQEIISALGKDPATRLVMISMGGITTRIDVQILPRIGGIHWLVPAASDPARDDVTAIESINMSHTDIVSSCDALITKPGYGYFAEAAANGTPVLYIRRGIWPEEPLLVEWLKQHSACLEMERQTLESGNIGQPPGKSLEAAPPTTGCSHRDRAGGQIS